MTHNSELVAPVPERKSIGRDPVFVFGSNLAGIHGAGAALHAARWLGAKKGCGEGPMGGAAGGDPLCYALPTKANPSEALSLPQVRAAVDRFLEFAVTHPYLCFRVTRVGCGLAGFKDEEVATLFDGAPQNCLLPGVWLARRDPGVARVIVAGSRGITDSGWVFGRIAAVTRRKQFLSGFEIVSGMARGVDTLAVDWARRSGYAGSVVGFPADWDRFGRGAGFVRNQEMAWYSTHLLALWDGHSPGTRHMIDTALAGGLKVKVFSQEAVAQAT